MRLVISIDEQDVGPSRLRMTTPGTRKGCKREQAEEEILDHVKLRSDNS
jgi:hypothetical protein